MAVFDKLLGFVSFGDMTETEWWADSVFRGLQSDWLEEHEVEVDVTAVTTHVPAGDADGQL